METLVNEERILALLANGPCTTASLAETLLGSKKLTQPINHLLYPMQKVKLVRKTAERPPTWALPDADVQVELTPEQERILTFLRTNPASRPQEVAAHLEVELKVANRLLYQLADLQKAAKQTEASGGKPRWSVV